MTIKFGSFDSVCQTAALVPCPLLGGPQGIEPTCYSRNVEIGGFLFFQPCAHTFLGRISCTRTDPHGLATFFVHLVALVMTAIMVYHIRGKYTAVGAFETLKLKICALKSELLAGRKEILTFFYLYAIIELLAIFLDTNIIPSANEAYVVRRLDGSV